MKDIDSERAEPSCLFISGVPASPPGQAVHGKVQAGHRRGGHKVQPPGQPLHLQQLRRGRLQVRPQHDQRPLQGEQRRENRFWKTGFVCLCFGCISFYFLTIFLHFFTFFYILVYLHLFTFRFISLRFLYFFLYLYIYLYSISTKDNFRSRFRFINAESAQYCTFVSYLFLIKV